MAPAFLAMEGAGNWDAWADFNRSGQVNIADFSLLVMNFNATSPVLITD